MLTTPILECNSKNKLLEYPDKLNDLVYSISKFSKVSVKIISPTKFTNLTSIDCFDSDVKLTLNTSLLGFGKTDNSDKTELPFSILIEFGCVHNTGPSHCGDI